MFSTPNCFDVPKHLWHTDPEFRKAVLREYEKTIPEQMAKDFIRELDMSAISGTKSSPIPSTAQLPDSTS